MGGRSRNRRVTANSPLVDLDLVFADDALIDAIADRPWGSGSTSFAGHRGAERGEHTTCAVLSRDPLAEIFEGWRDELAADPLPPPPSVRGPLFEVDQPAVHRRGSIRPALAVAAAIAAVLVGAACVGSKDATPDSALWTVTTVLWPSRAQSVESALHAQVALEDARTALTDGRSRDAQLALLRAAVELDKIEEADGRVSMEEQVANLWVATAPGEFAIDPELSELVTVAGPDPAVADPPTATTLPLRPAEVAAPVSAPSAGTTGLPESVADPLGDTPGRGTPEISSAVPGPGSASEPVLAEAVGGGPAGVFGPASDPTSSTVPAQDGPAATAGRSTAPSAPSTLPPPTVPAVAAVVVPTEHAPAVEQSPPPTPPASVPDESVAKPIVPPWAGLPGLPAAGAAVLPDIAAVAPFAQPAATAPTDPAG